MGDHPSVRPTWECRRAGSPLPVRPCSGWGLPSRPGRPGRWCALTAPFHPHLCPFPGGNRPSAVCSLWHFPAGRPDWPLASILPCGAPTFLSVETTPRPPGRLTVPTSLAAEFLLRHPCVGTSNAPDMEALVDTRISVVVPSAISPDDRLLEGWYLRGACRGLESAIFYPDPAEAAEEARALDVCSGCEVRSECLDHALARRESTGIWGGTTERDRRRILRRRRNA